MDNCVVSVGDREGIAMGYAPEDRVKRGGGSNSPGTSSSQFGWRPENPTPAPAGDEASRFHPAAFSQVSRPQTQRAAHHRPPGSYWVPTRPGELPPTIIQRQREHTPLAVSLSGRRIGQPVMLAMTVAAVGTGSMYSTGSSSASAADNPGTLDRSNYQQFATLGNHLEDGTVLEATTNDGDGDNASDRDSFTEYTVQEGDELKSIAASFGLRTSTLVWANNLANPDLIYTGDVLVIPPTDGVAVQVQEGDTLRDIATQYGVTVTAIINYEPNHVSDPDMIYPGQTLIIPGGMPPLPAETSAASSESSADFQSSGNAEATTSAPEAAPQPEGIYIDVQAGDTLRSIAERYGVSAQSIIDWGPNGLTNPDALSVGQSLFLPGGVEPEPEPEPAPAPEPEPEPEPEGINIEVQPGDSLLAIAERYGVTAQAIIDWGANGISNPNALSVGQSLFIPGGIEPVAEFQESSSPEVVAEASSEPEPEPEPQPAPEPQPEPEPEPAPAPEPEPEPEPEPQPQPSNDAGVAAGNFIWPTEGVITQRFGHTSFSQSSGWYGSSGHTGLDVANSVNTPIKAADGGTVIVSGWSGGYGYAVAIDHGNGYVTWYAHMAQQPPVGVGQRVAQGEYIGPMGSTGYSTGSHLHFEVRKNGNYQDPLAYLR
jgi:murein DD-endopeptidase MepM/ murein hydrolase activator NlpD